MQKTKWNLELLVPKNSDHDKLIQEVRQNVEKFVAKYKDETSYLNDPKELRKALDDYEKLTSTQSTIGNVGFYWYLKDSLNSEDTKVKKMVGQISELSSKLWNSMLFFEYKISKIAKKDQEKFLKSTELKPYKHYLKGMFDTSKYLLSEKEEKLITLLSKSAFGDWVSMTSDFVSKQELKVLTENGDYKKIPQAEVTKYLQSKDKKVRDYASKQLAKLKSKFEDVAEREMNAILYTKKTLDELKKVKRPDELRHVSDDIDTKVVDAMVTAVTNNFDLPKKWYELKAKLMNQKKLEFYERGFELGTIDKEFSYEDSVKLVKKVFKDLDSQFLEIFEEMLAHGQIDVFPAKGKRSGAFSWSALKSSPNFVFLNHTDDMRSVTTLAHEMGHAIHSVLSNKQNALNSGHTLATAEVASTFMEDFVSKEILKSSTKEEQFYLLTRSIDNEIATIHRQVAAYNFERDLHNAIKQTSFLSKDEISKIFRKNMNAYMGSFVKRNHKADLGWVVWSHFRRPFYVYSYASGLLISKALQSMVRENPKNIEKVKTFLEAGCSKATKDIFAEIGVDITDSTFWQRGLDEISQTYEKIYSLAQDLKQL